MQKRDCYERAGGPAWVRRAMTAAMVIAAALLPVQSPAQVNTTTVQGTVYRADGTQPAERC